ncbi:restriction endonuclease subunit S [Shouchella clausii]|uniref:restriction endonuclease subunit S n=1 Tax=Shouchella clausii TaxID=79880 RepID=UPI000BA728FC|nr:restriction endonuclease subunit S [Shouchella clausii]PAE92472.1 hypothetical protein CHH70_14600 [Shouchella clausii]
MKKVILSDLVKSLESGSRPKGGVSEKGIPSLGGEHVSKDGNYKFEKVKYIPEVFYQSLKKGIIKSEDILIVKDGATTGRVAFIDEFFPFKKAAVNEHLFKLSVDKEKVIPKYIYYYLLSGKGNSELMKDFRGATVGGISKKFIDFVKVPLPNKDIQLRVVNVLDKSRNLVNKRKAQIEALDQLTQSVFLEMFGDVRINAKNFPEAKLKEVISKISTGKSLAGNESSQYKVLKTSAVSFKFFKPNEVKNLPRDYVPPKNHLVNKADVLVSRMNTSELVGAAGYVFDEIENVALPDRIWKLHYNEKINPIYLWYYINQPSFRNKVSDIATGTSGSMKNIAQKKYLDIDIVLPPIEIQKQFGEILIKFENMKRQMNKSLIEIEKTFNSIIQRAFKGKLFTEEKLPTA